MPVCFDFGQVILLKEIKSMAKARVIKGGLVRVFIGTGTSPVVYTIVCGFTSKSITQSKNLEEQIIPDCDDPDVVDWVGRGATSLSMSISGEGVVAEQSIDLLLTAIESTDSVPVKVEMDFPSKTITWVGKMHIDSLQADAGNGSIVKMNLSFQSDGEMVRVTKDKTEDEG